MPKVHGVDKVVDPALKPETQAKREEVPKPKEVEPKYMSQHQRRVSPVIPRKEQGRTDARRKIT